MKRKKIITVLLGYKIRIRKTKRRVRFVDIPIDLWQVLFRDFCNKHGAIIRLK